MTLLALVSYHSYEITKRRLQDREAELKSIQSSALEFREKTSQAFLEQKSLKLRIESLERSLANANEQLNSGREEAERLKNELAQLRSEYEVTKQSLTEAYKRLRENP